MKSLETIRAEWGADGFDPVPMALLEDARLSSSLRSALCEIGLPVRPISALKLNLRFENVQITHRPHEVRLLAASDFASGSPFPRSGHPGFDAETTLADFLLLGECPNDLPRSGHLTRLICLDCASGKVHWVYPKLHEGRIDSHPINSSFHAYLGSLLAYKNFRDQWPPLMEKYPADDEDIDREAYEKEAKPIYEQFLRDLQEADPSAFKGGFWEEHAWNEAILLEL